MRIFTNLALLGITGYLVWSNRFQIQKFLESNGIRTPWINDNVSDAVRSGAAKVSGSLRDTERRAV